jgi:hypothetical protein
MFSAFELGTLFIKTPLRNLRACYVKPDVVRLVISSNTFTILGVRLDIPPIVFVSLNTLDVCTLLTTHVLVYILLERPCVFECWGREVIATIDTHGKEFKHGRVWRFRKVSTVKRFPWDVRVTGRHLV